MSNHRLGLVGKSLAHSFSKSFFTEFFIKEKITGSYENLEFEKIKDLEVFFESGIRDYDGLNVTLPYKEKIIPLLDEIDDEAKKIGAVNTIKVDGLKTIGFNTDAYGFHQSIKPFLTNKHERALVLGTGGSSKAVEHTLNKIGLDVLFISREKKNEESVFTYEELNSHMLNACKLIVNCTPIGMAPHFEETIHFPYVHLTKDHLVIDLIYNPSKTKFLEHSERHGAMILNGSSMLREQAIQSWKIWTK